MKWRNCCGYELGGGSQHVNEAAVNAMMKSAYGKIESTHEFATQRKSEDQGGNAKSASYVALAR
jgi:hypothetical protein